ncbi:type III secretion system export apparatus subunit SctS [Piscinibacter gummiphilus]|uniref:EscS/YscS/HrcS family type III secretion system export apparatus protein n=1 Tax=Piscinibacter gummiphilus TaxID=946333 RepID=A0A1W6L997_9BURK|nr:type III secretion system export apparatus subunit SctS [Piscinibacter gummiphilus]ARN20790.1 EscS/YscS/HrcS family type III secretion system export apparatus protein [Piscinibacter gummiphilus]ATU65466.1 EscS/YscS/HrcS family type III secretion system export apparatus protein [Piscinibacter gummiphilus]GLS94622.1 EscS/YscS/HrcS family type III secretion system export apparatus protein [Piscinibacter gummiphilus]
MGTEDISRVTSQALLLCLVVSLPTVLVAATVGLLIAFVQAVTSLQEQAIGQGAKMIAVLITLLLAAPWGARMILEFANSMMRLAMA